MLHDHLFLFFWYLTPCSLVDTATTHHDEKLAFHIHNFRLHEGRYSTGSLHVMKITVKIIENVCND
jgi:hypothetical protein